MARWILQTNSSTLSGMQEFPLSKLPQMLGRDKELNYIIPGDTVSRNHAWIEASGDDPNLLMLTDLNSRNGTFVNRSQIDSPTPVGHGDVIHLGHTELRLIDKAHLGSSAGPEGDSGGEETQVMGSRQLSQNFPSGTRDLEQLIDERLVNILYQPIVRSRDHSYGGFEALCRGASDALPIAPYELFHIAESMGLDVRLSQMLRYLAIETAVKFNLPGDIYVNTHPSEVVDPDELLASLAQVRRDFSDASIMLEIHEQSVTGENNFLVPFKAELDRLNINIAFDDFGVGQSRLMEMVESKPSVVKFDRKLIEDLDKGDEGKLNLLRTLTSLTSSLAIESLAECIGTQAEFEACKAIGFDFYQGFYFEKPQLATYYL